MFDDDKPKDVGTVPGNLPIGDPEDIFSGTPTNPSAAPAHSVDPPSLPETPMPEELPQKTALDAGVLQPKNIPLPPEPIAPVQNSPQIASAQPPLRDKPNMPPPITTPPQPMHPAQAVGQDNAYAIKEPIGNRRAVLWVILIMVVVVLGIGSMWIYFSIIKNDNKDNNFYVPDSTETTIDTTATTPDQTEIDTSQKTTSTNESDEIEDTFDINEQILLGEPLDTDGDGLDDIYESNIKTDPLNWDTDGDELGDGDEVTIWKTDPLKADTDGDSYLDGAEIKNGYNPAGPGKLFEPPSPTSTIEELF